MSDLKERSRPGWFNLMDGSMLYLDEFNEETHKAYGLSQTEVDTGETSMEMIGGERQHVRILRNIPNYVEVPFDLIDRRIK